MAGIVSGHFRPAANAASAARSSPAWSQMTSTAAANLASETINQLLLQADNGDQSAIRELARRAGPHQAKSASSPFSAAPVKGTRIDQAG
jgi:hypothetical protein